MGKEFMVTMNKGSHWEREVTKHMSLGEWNVGDHMSLGERDNIWTINVHSQSLEVFKNNRWKVKS